MTAFIEYCLSGILILASILAMLATLSDWLKEKLGILSWRCQMQHHDLESRVVDCRALFRCRRCGRRFDWQHNRFVELPRKRRW